MLTLPLAPHSAVQAFSRAPARLLPAVSPTVLQAKRNTPLAALLLTTGLMELGLDLAVGSGMPDTKLVSWVMLLGDWGVWIRLDAQQLGGCNAVKRAQIWGLLCVFHNVRRLGQAEAYKLRLES